MLPVVALRLVARAAVAMTFAVARLAIFALAMLATAPDALTFSVATFAVETTIVDVFRVVTLARVIRALPRVATLETERLPRMATLELLATVRTVRTPPTFMIRLAVFEAPVVVMNPVALMFAAEKNVLL